MFKTLSLIVTLALVASAASHTKFLSNVEASVDPQQVIKCIEDITTGLSDVATLVNDAKSGEITKFISDLTPFVAEVGTIVQDCSAIAGSEFERFASGNIITCIKDVYSFYTEAKQTVADYQAGDMAKALQDVVALVATGKSAIEDCKSVTKN